MCGLLAVVWMSQPGAGIRLSRGVAPLAALVLVGIWSGAGASSASQAIEGLRDLVLLGLPAALLGATVLTTPRRVLACANAVGVAAFLVAVVGLLQHQHVDWWGYRPTVSSARGDVPPPVPDLLQTPLVGSLIRALYTTLDRLARPETDLSWLGPLEGPA